MSRSQSAPSRRTPVVVTPPQIITIQVALSLSARQEHFLRTGDALPATIAAELPTVQLERQIRALFLQLAPDLPEYLALRLPSLGRAGPLWEAPSVPSTPSDWATLLRAYHEAHTAAAAAVALRREAALRWACARLRSHITRWNSLGDMDTTELDLHDQTASAAENADASELSDNDPENIATDPAYAHCPSWSEAQVLLARLAHLSQISAERHAAEAAAQAAHYQAERRTWIAAHGSSRLRQALDRAADDLALLRLDAVYIDERRAHDYPGYRELTTENLVPAPNPSAEAVAEAQRVGGTVRLLQRDFDSLGLPRKVWEVVAVDSAFQPDTRMFRPLAQIVPTP